ncbi:hypothetical protein Y1Q_0021428 [Alligator mississippiensis]|uniref:Uncharacterized protein n=1 Tax=Alligator mississippiensis TaxID=8496 RepID=A0A151PA30_ALLMI|nr:hypothetical protein Y1Q_0021428 [Alligator mississippiensis]
MTWATFLDLLEQLWPHIECQDTTMWLPSLPVDTQLAFTLKMATLTSFPYVVHLFGVDKATAGEVILENHECPPLVSFKSPKYR